jgi:isopenicillin N synthase-like dioxygenase
VSTIEPLAVDLLEFERGSAAQRAAIVEGVMDSLGTGFVYTSHDIPRAVLDDAYEMLATFFTLPVERKARWNVPESHGQAGYTGLLVEAHHPLRTKYPHRYLPPVLPEDDVPGITATLMEMSTRVLDLQSRFLHIIGVGLGVHEAYFDDILRDGTHLTRAIHYPAMTGAPDPAHVWADGHADINLITALPRATSAGLQLHTADGWHDIEPPEGHAIVNSGMMLERISNGRIPAGVHRVVAGDEPGDRYSVVQFCHPAPWFQLAPLPSAVDAAHPLRYGSIEAGDLLDRVLYEIGLIKPD